MSKKKSPAKAASKDVPDVIEGARLIRSLRDGKQYPAALYAADEVPAKGDTLRLVLSGVTYAGKVRAATEADGEVLAEFQDGLSPE